MCLYTVQHFTYHRVALRMTTEPFTTDGTGDFTNPFTVLSHDCGVSVREPIPAAQPHTSKLPQVDLEWCEWHGTCCVIWVLADYCKNRRGRGQESHCHNIAYCHEYRPITDVMEPYQHNGQYPTSWVDTHPSFPIELLYTRERRSAADCEGIKFLRESFCDMASTVLIHKRRLADDMNDAWDHLCKVQQALGDRATYPPAVILPEAAKAIQLVETSREQMNTLLRYTREAVKLFHDLQAALHGPAYRKDYGDHSSSLIAINPDTFEEGPQSLKLVFDAFDGPLKQIPELFEMCKRMRLVGQQLQVVLSSNP